ncbi:MAG TPA: hypothetical protein VJR94_00555 [Candidatus Nitrosocosmicus sp.]|nr:hypothetical protein [Candidatus Nitrosocosmicus sp.]
MRLIRSIAQTEPHRSLLESFLVPSLGLWDAWKNHSDEHRTYLSDITINSNEFQSITISAADDVEKAHFR